MRHNNRSIKPTMLPQSKPFQETLIRGHRAADQCLCFAKWIGQSLYIIRPQLQASCYLLWLCSSCAVLFRTWSQSPKKCFFRNAAHVLLCVQNAQIRTETKQLQD